LEVTKTNQAIYLLFEREYEVKVDEHGSFLIRNVKQEKPFVQAKKDRYPSITGPDESPKRLLGTKQRRSSTQSSPCKVITVPSAFLKQLKPKFKRTRPISNAVFKEVTSKSSSETTISFLLNISNKRHRSSTGEGSDKHDQFFCCSPRSKRIWSILGRREGIPNERNRI
jgi:hypothetical protein